MIENNYVLQTKLGPGNYTLWLYALPDRKLTNIPSHPFSLQFSISQIHADESFLSCPELFLPESLNTPGLIDATGFLHYRDEVLLDLSKKSQTVTVCIPNTTTDQLVYSSFCLSLPCLDRPTSCRHRHRIEEERWCTNRENVQNRRSS